MAKKRTIETPENVASEKGSPENSVAEDTEYTAEVIDEQETAADFSALPVQAVDYLKRHTEVDAIYIDKLGGTFHKDTPKVLVMDAILYQNPYFKQ